MNWISLQMERRSIPEWKQLPAAIGIGTAGVAFGFGTLLLGMMKKGEAK